MSQALVALNRLVAFLVGLILIAGAAAGVLWWRGAFPSWPTRIDTRPAVDLAGQTWWPWAAGSLGLALILIGLRWLVANLPNRGICQLRLPGSTPQGRLIVQVRPVANAAAKTLGNTTGVRSASATIREERGQLVARLNATIEQQADLIAIAAAADQVSTDLARVLQREDMSCQVNLTVAHRARSLSRVD